jgi:hypothetical protein
MWVNSIDILSRPPQFHPHPGGGVGWQWGVGGEAAYHGKSLVTAKMRPFLCQLSASQTSPSEHFLHEIKYVAFCA